MILHEATEPLEVIPRDSGAGLGLDRHTHVPYYEVDFDAAREPPVRQRAVNIPIAHESGQLMKQPVLEGLAVELRAGKEFAASRQSVHDTDVNEVKLGSTDNSTLGSLAIRRKPSPEQRVFQNLEVALRRVTRYGALTGDVREVHDLPIAQRGDIQKVRERRKISHQTLRGDFLLEIICDVRIEHARGPARLVDPRKVPVVEHPIQVEVAPDLVRRQTVEFVANGPSAEKIRRAPLDLTGARATEREVKPAILDEPMHLVEQRRYLLDLVDDDLAPRPGGISLQLLAEEFGPGDIAAELVGLEQVHPAPAAVCVPQQCALAGLARPPQEESLSAGLR